ncbi:methyltransferase domain-containing protein [Kitasatospora sp. NPDC002551]|uniref:methyltransferase domain-containing protein n=1 Tax=unclassified Kitasatospora TaxID=2633591 RepID=UPI00332B41A5
MEDAVEQESGQGPSAQEVGAWYDRLGGLYSLTMGDNMHMGMWEGGRRPDPGRVLSADEAWQELTAAQDRWTDDLIAELGLAPHQRALDIGCGTGRPTVRLAAASGGHVIGITASRSQAEQATARAEREQPPGKAEFVHGDAMDLPFEDESFDALWAIESFAHFSDRPRALRQAWRVLRPGGRLVLADCLEAVPFTEQEARLFRGGFALAPLPRSLDDYPALVRGAGFAIERVLDRSADFAPTYDLIPLVYAGRREQLARRLGAEAAGQLDTAYPLILDLCRDKLGYVMVSARKTAH